ncbi:MAG: hypothetical protein LBM98_05280 [Oscillospiraceae bacterium]|nr:hypothetical protein [Oscillospiraceae bacterium]
MYGVTNHNNYLIFFRSLQRGYSSQEGTRITPRGGETTPPLRGHPSTEGIGEWTRDAEYGRTWCAVGNNDFVTPVQTPVLIPSVEGCRPQAAGWFPAPRAEI